MERQEGLEGQERLEGKHAKTARRSSWLLPQRSALRGPRGGTWNSIIASGVPRLEWPHVEATFGSKCGHRSRVAHADRGGRHGATTAAAAGPRTERRRAGRRCRGAEQAWPAVARSPWFREGRGDAARARVDGRG